MKPTAELQPFSRTVGNGLAIARQWSEANVGLGFTAVVAGTIEGGLDAMSLLPGVGLRGCGA